MMEVHEEDGEILEVIDEVRHHSSQPRDSRHRRDDGDLEARDEGRSHHSSQSRERESRHRRDDDDEEFSMSSFDGDQGDALDIKPPQAVVPRREKREKRDKRDRHRHKGDRSKSRSHSRGHHREERGERRREHRKHREHDPERHAAREAREARRHEKQQHRDRNSKHDRAPVDLRNKIPKRKIPEKDMDRHHTTRDEYYMDQRDPYYRQGDHRLHRRGGSGDAGLGRGAMSSSDYSNYGSSRSGGQIDDRLAQLSPRSREEKDRRMARFS